MLQFEKMHSWYTIEKTVAIINACHDHALYKQFIDGGRRQELPYLSDIMQLIVDYLQVLLKVAAGRTYNCHCCLTKL